MDQKRKLLLAETLTDKAIGLLIKASNHVESALGDDNETARLALNAFSAAHASRRQIRHAKTETLAETH